MASRFSSLARISRRSAIWARTSVSSRLQLLDLEPGQPREPHVEDRLGLPLGQPEALLQLARSPSRCRRGPDQLDDLVDVVDGDLETFQDVLAIERLLQLVLGALDRPPRDGGR